MKAAIALLTLLLIAPQNGYELFQRALVKARAEGNFDEAIEIYRRILRDHHDNRSLVAKTLVQIGECYEKLKKPDARNIYEQVLRDYSDQNEAVAEARIRLAAVSPEPSAARASMVVRKLWAGSEVDINGSISPDGKQLSFVDWTTSDLSIHDLASGSNRRLTTKQSSTEFGALAARSVISLDGKQIAYLWFGPHPNKQDWQSLLRVTNTDGSKPFRILYHNPEIVWTPPAAWTPDGKRIVSVFAKKDRTNQIVLVSVDDGSVQVLKSLDWRIPSHVTLSRDGRYIAYDFPPTEDSTTNDIFILALDGSRESVIVPSVADDVVLGWTPDNRSLLFASDRAGSMDAWLVRIENGKSTAAPELIRKNIGRIEPLGMTAKGTFYYGLLTGMRDVFLASFDSSSAKIQGTPTRATERFIGSTGSPDWSAGGKRIVYIADRRFGGGGAQFGGVLSILSLEDGSQRELTPKLTYLSQPRWSPDSRSILVRSADRKGREGLFLVDVETSAVTPVVFGNNIYDQIWFPDGTKVVYRQSQREEAEGGSHLIVHDLRSGEQKVIYRRLAKAVAISPDGKYVAYKTPSKAFSALRMISADGGEERELVDEKENVEIPFVEWARDGQHIFFGRQHKGGIELWRVSTKGGDAQRLDFPISDPREFRIHPNGKLLAFTSGQTKAEVWVMENFLPRTIGAVSDRPKSR